MAARHSRINLWRTERRRRRIERYLNVAIGLIWIVLAMGLVRMGSIVMQGIRQDQLRTNLELSLRHLHQEMTAIEPQVAQAQAEVEALAHDTLPNLIPIGIGQPIAIDNRFVDSIAFTLADPDNGRGLQYRLSAHNTVKSAIQLRCDIFFFDRKGKAIGVSHLGTGGAENPTMLERGELRTVSAPIEGTAGNFSERDIRYFKMKFPE